MLEIHWIKIGLLSIFYVGMKLYVRSNTWYETSIGLVVSMTALQILLERVHDL